MQRARPALQSVRHHCLREVTEGDLATEEAHHLPVVVIENASYPEQSHTVCLKITLVSCARWKDHMR